MNDLILLSIFSFFIQIGICGLFTLNLIEEKIMIFVKKTSITYNIFALPVSPKGWNKFVVILIFSTMIVIGTFTIIFMIHNIT